MKRLALVLLVASGCKKEDPLFCEMNPGKDGCPGTEIDASVDDGGVETDVGPDARVCFGSGNFEVCLTSAPSSSPVVFPSATFDTATTNTACLTPTPPDWLASHPDACIVAGESITLSNPLAVTGPRPLVLLAATTLSINASIDAAGHVAGTSGPGAPSALCPAYTNIPDNSTSGAGGGAGGSFITAGGIGGQGNNGGSDGGSPTATAGAPTTLRAGCHGQSGGTGTGGAGSEGVNGLAGGAILLIAGGSITIASNVTINASGGGGRAPLNKFAGGGGGGSAGMIVLEAPAITATGAFLMANGGGGASGAEDSGNGNGTPGEDPTPGSPLIAADGGTGPDNAGNGGDGWVQGDTTAAPGGIGGGSRAGGGGGGGGGYIRVSTATGATSSPAEDIVP